MAVKKTIKSAGAKAAPKASAPKAPAKQGPAARAAGPKGVASKAAASKAAGPRSAVASGASPKKKAAPIKLTDKQTELLKRVHVAQEGYTAGKGEARSLDSLQTKKLIKRGARDKESGNYRFSVSRAGEKHLSTPPAGNG